jgi:hypothetical protein
MTIKLTLTAETDNNITGLKEEIAAALEKLGITSVLVTEILPVQTRLGDVWK